MAFVLLVGSLQLRRKQRRLADVPLSKVQGVFIGFVELAGTAETESPLLTPFFAVPCVYHTWEIEEHWSRMVTETYTNDKGEACTRTRQESGWSTVASGGVAEDFYLRDETGVIRIRPQEAKVEAERLDGFTCRRSDPRYYGFGPRSSVSDSDGERRFTERGIRVHAPLFVAGHVRERDDIVAAEIAASPDCPDYLISTKSRDAVLSSASMTSWACGFLGLAVTVAPPFLRGHIDLSDVSPPAMLILPLGYLALWPLGSIWTAYNCLVELRQRVRQAWSLIDVQLKRRHDLIPQIARVCEALAGHERTVQTAVARLRAELAATPPGQPGPDHIGCVSTLRAVVESYPSLIADHAFLGLQRQLVETEQRIALARGYYNDIATNFATHLQSFPENLVAALGRFRPEPLFAAENFERATVRVSLVDGSSAPPPAPATPPALPTPPA